jgi:hypothetical protein
MAPTARRTGSYNAFKRLEERAAEKKPSFKETFKTFEQQAKQAERERAAPERSRAVKHEH